MPGTTSMRSRLAGGTATTLSLVCILAAGGALADSKTDAKRHFDRAVELLHDAQPREAIIEFQRAYDLKPHYLPLYNIGQAYIQLAQPVDAVEYLERSLREGGNSIPARRRDDLEAEIKRQQTRIAVLEITVEPSGAKVRVDGRDLGPAPILARVKVGIGTHSITAALDGYREGEVHVAVAGEESRAVRLRLEKVLAPSAPRQSPQGQVLVDCPVPEAEVSVDGTPAGKTPLAAAILVPTGIREIRFSRAGYSPTQQRVAVPDQGAASVSCRLRPLNPVPYALAAHLTVASSEDGSDVRVDGMPMPSDGRVPMGLHHVEVSQPGFAPWKTDVRVEARQQANLKAALVPTPAFRKRYESKARTQRILGYVLGGSGLVLVGSAVGVYKWNDGRYRNWQTERDALDQLWAQRPPYPPEVQLRQDSNDELIRSVQRSDKVVVGLSIGGGALLTTGVVLLLTGDSPSRYDSVAVLPQPGGGVLGWMGRW